MSYNRHFFRNLNLGKESKPNPYKNDIIVDPRGQWNHPGQNTRIPGNEITMQGVPYPVWAQPNVGPGRMMQPGMNYTFPGAEYVDEIPMAQRGGATRRGYDPSTGRMISLSNVPGASIITDPSDPRMQMYMDSLNLYKAHQRQLLRNPRTDTYDDRTDDLETFYTGAIGKDPNTTYFSDINEYKRIDAGRDRLLKKYGLHDDDELPDDAEEYRQRWTDLENDPEFDYYYPSMEAATNMALYKHPAYGTSWGDRDLADYYNSLSFYQPAVTGLWDTPDLGHSTILPSGKYFGGAWNPIYDKPKQPFYYEGNPKDLEKYRDQIMYSGVERDWKGAGRPDAQYLRKKGTTDPKKSVTVNLIKSGLAKDSKSAKEVRKQLLEQVFGEELTGSAEQNTKLNKWLFDNPEAMETFKETGSIKKAEEDTAVDRLPLKPVQKLDQVDPTIRDIVSNIRPESIPDLVNPPVATRPDAVTKRYSSDEGWVEDTDETRGATERKYDKERWEWAQQNRQEGGQIKIKESNKGKFTKKAKAAGMSVQEFASKVLAATEGRYSASTRKQANFARNASKWKKQEGGDIMKYQIEGEVAPPVESTEPTEEEIFQATLDWFNTHPYADMPSMSDLSEIHGAESQVPKWKEMRGDKPGERYQGVYVPFANVTARPTVEGEKQKRGQFYYDTVPIEDGANRLNIVMVGDKPMVMPPTQGDMSNAEYRDITRMYDRFNKEYLHTYKKPARRKSGTSEVFHVYGAGLPYASDKSAWYEQYPSMNPDQQQDGGYIELELTDQEIEQYRKGGYIVEELPKAQEGIINLSGPRASKAEYLDIEDDVKEFADRYVTSEHHRNLLEKQGYPEDKIYWRMQDVLNYQPSLHTRFKTHGNSYVGAAGEGDIPLSLDSGQEVGMPVVSYNVLNPHPFPLDQVVSHEWGHIPVSTGFNPLTENERKEFINRLKPGVAKNEHDLEPQENRSDQFELRYFLDREGIYDSSKGEKFTQKHLDEYRKKTGAPNRMFKLYEDKDIIWLMNNIAATDTEPQGLVKAQRGGEYNFGPTDPAERKKLYNYNIKQEVPDMILTLKDDKSFIDGIANWSMVSGVPINDKFNEQIKNRLYTGKWGYNPKTGYLVNLNKISPQKTTKLSESEKQFQKKRVDIPYEQAIENWEKDRVPVQIANEDTWSPHFGFETMQGMQDADDYRGRTVYMTQEEADEYTKARTQHNWGAVYQNPLWYAPGMIFGATVAPMYGAIASAPGLYESGKNIYEGDASALDYANVLTAGVAARNIPHMPKLPANIKNITTPSRQKITNFLVEKNIVSADPDLITAGFNPLKKVFGTDIKLKNIADKGKAAGLTPQQIAQRQMNEVGITTAQREAYTPLVSDLLYYGINPRGTGFGVPGKVAAMPFNWASAGLKKFTGRSAYSPAGLGARDDAWSLFLGKPQRAGTFSMAETVPTPGIYKPGSLQGMEKFSINALQRNPHVLATDLLWNWAKNRGDKGIYPHQGTPFFAGETSIYPTDQFADVMGGYNLRRTGPNTLEYNDIWDLAVPGVPESIANRFLGKKFLSTGQAQFDDLGQTLHTIAAKKGYKGTENLGDFIPKTTGTGVTTPTSLGQTGPISQSSFFKPTWAKKVKEKLSKTELSTPVPEGTPYHEIGSKNLIEESIKGMPVETRDFPFAGTNVYSPLTPSGMPAGAAQYKWPAGISKGQLDNFVSKIYSNEVPVKTIEAVFDSLTKLNPEIKELVGSGVPKSDIIAYMSGGMDVKDIPVVYKSMNEAPRSGPSQSGLLDVFKRKPKNIEISTEAQDLAHAEAIQFGKDWFLDPDKVAEFEAARNSHSQAITDYLNQATKEGKAVEFFNVPFEFKGDIMDPIALEKINKLADQLEENILTYPGQSKPGQELVNAEDLLITPIEGHPSLDVFPTDIKQDIVKQASNRVGVNMGSGISLTHRGTPNAFGGFTPFSPEYVAATGVHELGHTAQTIKDWNNVITKYDPNFGYFTPNKDTEIGRRFAEAMVEPKTITALDKMAGKEYNEQTWRSSPGELHSELMTARYLLWKEYVNRGHDPKFVLEMLKRPTDEMLDIFLDQLNLNKHFKEGVDIKEKRELLRMLPVLIPAVGVTAAGALQEEQDGGFIELELTDEEIEQYKKGGYIVTEV